MKATLSFREERFVAEYLIDQNGAAAAARAGYSVKSSGYAARDLMKKPLVRERVRMEMQGLLSRVKASAAEVLMERVRGAFFKPSKMVGPGWKLRPFEEMEEETLESLQIIVVQRKYGEEVRIKQPNREKALAALEKVHERLERLNERQWDEELRQEREEAREVETREGQAEREAEMRPRRPVVMDAELGFPVLSPPEGWEAYFEKQRAAQAGSGEAQPVVDGAAVGEAAVAQGQAREGAADGERVGGVEKAGVAGAAEAMREARAVAEAGSVPAPTDVFAHVREAMRMGVKPADLGRLRPPVLNGADQAGQAGVGDLRGEAAAPADGGAARREMQVSAQTGTQMSTRAGALANEEMPDSLIAHLALVRAGHIDAHAQREIERRHGRLGSRPGDARPPGADLGYNPPHLRRDRREYAVGAGECWLDGYGGE